MKINEVITKEAVISDLTPQQRKEQDDMARKEYRALIAMKSPNAVEFANLFMKFGITDVFTNVRVITFPYYCSLTSPGMEVTIHAVCRYI